MHSIFMFIHAVFMTHGERIHGAEVVSMEV